MKFSAIALALSAVLASAAVAAPGDPRLIHRSAGMAARSHRRWAVHRRARRRWTCTTRTWWQRGDTYRARSAPAATLLSLAWNLGLAILADSSILADF